MSDVQILRRSGRLKKRQSPRRWWWQDRSRRRRTLRIALPVLLTLALAGGVSIWWIQTAPYRVMRWYVEAVERGDFRTVHRLTDPREKSEVGVTAEGLRQAFQALNDVPLRAGRIDIGHMLKKPEGPLYQYFVNWLDGRTGKPLAGTRPFGRTFRESQASSFLVVKTTPEGLRVATTLFLHSTCRNRHGYLVPFVSAATQAGITGWIYRDGQVNRLEDIDSARLIPPQ